MNKVRERSLLVLKLMRPVFLIPALWVLIAGVLTTTGSFSLTMLPKVLVVAILGQLSVFSINDYFDRETDEINGRKGGVEGAVVTEENKDFVRNVVIASHLLLGLFAFFFLPGFALISGLVVMTASALYSAPPFRLKSVPFLDSLCNIIILYFGFGVAVGMAGGNFGDIIPGAFWFSVAFGGPGHMMASYIDRESDRKAGIKTSGMLLGRKGIVLLGQAIIAAMLFLEQWSMETRLMLLYTFLTAFYPLITEKHMKKALVAWSILPTIYIAVWIWLRI
ncbi:MAG: UbiA family prenyltransferase [Candidatus Nanohalobium sp.]